MDTTTFPHAEAELAERFGVAREDLAAWRKEQENGVDWKTVFANGRRGVCWSDAALGRFRSTLPAAAAQDEKNGAVAPAEERRLVVNRGPKEGIRNVRFVECVDPERPGEMIAVRVRDNANFRRVGTDGKPMAMMVRMVGPRLGEFRKNCPRLPGRW